MRTQRETKVDIPDAIFEVNGERHAIEVELSNKTKRRLRHTLEERSARYDAVIYFCGPRTRKLLDDAKGEGCWPKLIVRGLPEHPAWALPGRSMDSSSTSPWKPPPQPADWEVRIFRLLAEQGAIPVDQLSRFLDRSADETASVVAAFCEAHYTVSQQLLADQPAWVWLKERGARFSGTSLYPQRPRPGGLDRMRAVNEVRLHVSGRDPHVRWVSRRRLLRRYGQYAVVPSAVAESGDQRHALNVKLTMRNNLRLASQIRHLRGWPRCGCLLLRHSAGARILGRASERKPLVKAGDSRHAESEMTKLARSKSAQLANTAASSSGVASVETGASSHSPIAAIKVASC